MKKFLNKGSALAAFPLSALSLAISGAVFGQTSEGVAAEAENTSVEVNESTAQDTQMKVNLQSPIEEVLILGRMQSAAGDIVLERMELDVAADLMSAELISRVGDSNVAAALRRIPGVTLVDDKFVFVRGLGERYSSTTLNGAVIPSPDLTRNVVPLDIFPTSIVETLSVQKMASADMPAAFGGGSIDIRTLSIPESLQFNVELGLGDNSNSGEFLSYDGGDDDSWGEDDGTRALSDTLSVALTRYRGNFANIAEYDGLTQDEADEAIRNLALELNRDIGIEEDDGELDRSFEIGVGNNFDLKDDMQLGFLAGVSYDSSWRNSEKLFVNSDRRVDGSDEYEEQSLQKQSTYNVSLTGNFNLGFRLNSENFIKTTSLFIRNTDDKATVEDSFDNSAPITAGTSSRDYNIRYEQREMTVNQIHGEHEFGYDTRELLGLDSLAFLEGLTVDWYYSDSKSTSEIPNEVSVSGGARFGEGAYQAYSLNPLSSSVQSNVSAADFRFTELEDYVESHGWEMAFPMEFDRFSLKLSGGTEYWEKVRTYEQLQFGLGSVGSDAPTIGLPEEIFSDANIANPEFEFQTNVTSDNSESYIATAKVNAIFGKFDATWQDSWRLAAGLRWEDYQQVGLSWEVLDFTGSPLVPNGVEARAYEPTTGADGQESNVISDYFVDATFTEDDVYGSFALTYMKQGFWAEDFQLRMGYSETTVRPDLREITDSSYVDPLTDFLVFGQSGLVPAQFENYDVRAEWFFGNGDNLTVTLFYKDIQNPIDVAEVARSDDGRAVGIINAESAELTGLELEFLKSLGNVADFLEPFFVQGNATVIDTTTVVGAQALDVTNQERPLVGASNTVNLIFGFDSDDGKHASTISYNWFDERLFFAGRNGQNDVYEKPFGSLDFTYSYYPTQQFTVKLKAKNLLDESVEYEREGASFTLLEESKGMSFGITASYKY